VEQRGFEPPVRFVVPVAYERPNFQRATTFSAPSRLISPITTEAPAWDSLRAMGGKARPIPVGEPGIYALDRWGELAPRGGSGQAVFSNI
jgi:hypothetical protein